ncbi:MAG: hypothetical protein ACLSFT_09595 [Ruminococcus callidus]
MLANLLETIRIITVPLSAPCRKPCRRSGSRSASEADVAYSTAAFGTLPQMTVHKGDIIFPRIDVEKEIDELNQRILAAQPRRTAGANTPSRWQRSTSTPWQDRSAWQRLECER